VSVATPPAPAPTAAPPPADEACPLCGTRLDPEQEWCLRCGAAARTRLAASPSWKAPVIALAAVVALSLGVLAAALVTLAGGSGHSTKAPVTVIVTTAPAITTPPTATVPPATTTVPGATSTPTSPGLTPTTTAPGTTTQGTATPGATGTTTATTPAFTTPTATAPRATTPTAPATPPSHTKTSTAPPTSNPLFEESPKK
jgi:hypothetical protein